MRSLGLLSLALLWVITPASSLAQVGPNYVAPSRVVFPHIVVGAGWETDISLVSLGPTTSSMIMLNFRDESGVPMDVTMRPASMDGVLGYDCATPFTGDTAAGSTFCIHFFPGGSFQAKLTYPGSVSQTGWAQVGYLAMDDTIGGYETFRRLGTNGFPDFEASVPLSYRGDWEFYVPFDNRDGFVTAMALVNPGSRGEYLDPPSRPITVHVAIAGPNGAQKAAAPISLAVWEHRSFIVNDQFPETRNTFGTLIFQAYSGSAIGGDLSAFGLRFNPKGAFSTVPVLNYFTMYNIGLQVP